MHKQTLALLMLLGNVHGREERHFWEEKAFLG